MTNREILEIAMAQSAIDLCAKTEDFEKTENVIVLIYRSSNRTKRIVTVCHSVRNGKFFKSASSCSLNNSNVCNIV